MNYTFFFSFLGSASLAGFFSLHRNFLNLSAHSLAHSFIFSFIYFVYPIKNRLTNRVIIALSPSPSEVPPATKNKGNAFWKIIINCPPPKIINKIKKCVYLTTKVLSSPFHHKWYRERDYQSSSYSCPSMWKNSFITKVHKHS